MTQNNQPLEAADILKLLPHRYPFVLIDRILEYELNQRIVGLKNVTINEPFFQGHFPDQPVMPGVLIMEGMAQAAAVLAYLSDPEAVGGKLFYFAGMDGVRFRRKVVPGDQLHFELIMLKRKAKFWKMDGKALVAGKLVAEAQLMAILD